MELRHNETIYFAMRKESGQIVHISEMVEKDRGSACNCICTYCGRPLIAKLGHGRRIKHFAHLAEDTAIDCSAEKANESGLHKMAKNIICESTYLNLPEVEILAQNDPDRNMDDYNQQESLMCGRKFKLQYHKVQTEVLFNGFKPDVCILRENNMPLLIEIAVTHYTDHEKREKIKAAQLPTIEINIAEFFKDYRIDIEEIDDEFVKKLKEAIIDSFDHKIWIFHPKEEEGIQKLCERNRKLESEYQQNRQKTLKALAAQEKREKEIEIWKQEQKKIREQIDLEIEQLHADETYYLYYKDKIKWADDIVLNRINRLGICNLKFETVESIPFFLNIPVFGEVVFNCDRRIWQTILVEKVFYHWKYDEVSVPKIYYYFAGQQIDYLNRKFVYIWKRKGGIKFPAKKDLLCSAIGEYLVHLSALGFVDVRYYRYPSTEFSYRILRSTLEPQRTKYAAFLKNILKAFPDTNDPFGYMQEKWVKSGEELEYIENLDI